MEKQTAVEWLEEQINLTFYIAEASEMNKRFQSIYEQAKEMENEQKGYTEEQAKQIWKAGQEYWKTSGSSITFEELIETFNTKEK
jgi:hypothetical protein